MEKLILHKWTCQLVAYRSPPSSLLDCVSAVFHARPITARESVMWPGPAICSYEINRTESRAPVIYRSAYLAYYTRGAVARFPGLSCVNRRSVASFSGSTLMARKLENIDTFVCEKSLKNYLVTNIEMRIHRVTRHYIYDWNRLV